MAANLADFYVLNRLKTVNNPRSNVPNHICATNRRMRLYRNLRRINQLRHLESAKFVYFERFFFISTAIPPPLT